MLKTPKGWTIGLLTSAAVYGVVIILAARLLRGTAYGDWVESGLTILWWGVFFLFIGHAPPGTCRLPWLRKAR